MYIQLVREYYTKKSTEGKLFVNGEFECYTLEDTDRNLEDGGEKVYGKTAIPKGVYKITYTYSPRFKEMMPLLEDVANFEGVRIHWGNKPEDTDGCILVGKENTRDGDDWVGKSKVAYVRLKELIETAINNGEDVTIEIV